MNEVLRHKELELAVDPEPDGNNNIWIEIFGWSSPNGYGEMHFGITEDEVDLFIAALQQAKAAMVRQRSEGDDTQAPVSSAPPMGRPNTVKEWIAALRKLDPNLPLFVRPKYTGESSWVHDYPIFTKGLHEMEAGEVGYPHATILY